jgi:SAM-dependent methyltransferase
MARRRSINPVTGLPREGLARRLPRFLWRLATDAPARHAALLRLLSRRSAFQPFNTTKADRYPHIFGRARKLLGADRPLDILSFGCSTGEEVFTLRRYFPDAAVKGIDINRANIGRARARLAAAPDHLVTFQVAGDTRAEPGDHYDAIFCMAVLRDGRLSVSRPATCLPLLDFADFAAMVADFHRCLKPGGFLALNHANFRFIDAPVAARFEASLWVPPDQRTPLYDAANRLLPGATYADVLFRKLA